MRPRHIRRSFIVPGGCGLVAVLHLGPKGWELDTEERSGRVLLSQPVANPPEETPDEGEPDAIMDVAVGMAAAALVDNPHMIPTRSPRTHIGG